VPDDLDHKVAVLEAHHFLTRIDFFFHPQQANRGGDLSSTKRSGMIMPLSLFSGFHGTATSHLRPLGTSTPPPPASAVLLRLFTNHHILTAPRPHDFVYFCYSKNKTVIGRVATLATSSTRQASLREPGASQATSGTTVADVSARRVRDRSARDTKALLVCRWVLKLRTELQCILPARDRSARETVALIGGYFKPRTAGAPQSSNELDVPALYLCEPSHKESM
jgi:hypothetical protein